MTLRLLLLASLATIVIGGAQIASSPEAGARDRKASSSAKKARKAKPAKRYRSRAVARQDADCTYIDNGKPDSALDFRNPCDAQEFWRRQAERAGDVND